MTSHYRRGMLCALLAAAGTTGCYRYVPGQLEATPPGTDVRVLVTQEGAREMRDAGAISENDEPRVEGAVVGTEGGDLLVRVPIARRQNGFLVDRIDQSLRLPVDEIVSFQRRELDGVRTGLVLTGGAAVLAALIAVIADPLGGDNPDPEPPPDELMLLELLSIPVGR